jgi:hypothetical protein
MLTRTVGWLVGWLVTSSILIPPFAGYAGYHYWSLSLITIYIVPLHARRFRLIKAVVDSSAGGPCSGTSACRDCNLCDA